MAENSKIKLNNWLISLSSSNSFSMNQINEDEMDRSVQKLNLNKTITEEVDNVFDRKSFFEVEIEAKNNRNCAQNKIKNPSEYLNSKIEHGQQLLEEASYGNALNIFSIKNDNIFHDKNLNNSKTLIEDGKYMENSSSCLLKLSEPKQKDYISNFDPTNTPNKLIINIENNSFIENSLSKLNNDNNSPLHNKYTKKYQTNKRFYYSKRITARRRFHIIFKKIRIVLLFMYLIRFIKFFGLNILGEEVKREHLIIQRLKIKKSLLFKNHNEFIPNDVINESFNSPNLKRQGIFNKFSRIILINPEGMFMKYWNILLLSFIFYTATIMPYRCSFNNPPPYFTFWWVVEFLCDIVFSVDFIINCLLGFYNNENNLVMEWHLILLNYLKGWLMLDLISILPFQTTITNLYTDHIRKLGSTISYLSRLLRLFRIIKLLRIFRVFRLINQNKIIKKYLKEIKLDSSIKRILAATALFVIFSHIFACLWYFIAVLEESDIDSWVFRNGLLDAKSEFLYASSMYFILSIIATLGYGDITAESNIEKLFVIFLMISGTIYISFIISNLIGAISHYENKHSVIKEKIDILNKLANRIKMKNDTYIRIRKIVEENSINNLIFEQNELLIDLPHYLRVEIILHIKEKYIKQIFYFRERNPKFLIEIIQNWKKVHYLKNEFVYFIDDKPQEVLFLMVGNIIYIDDNGNIITKFSQGSILGEMEIILGKPRRFLNLRVLDHSEMNYLPSEIFKEILLKFMEEFRSSLKIAKTKFHKYTEIIEGSKNAGIVDQEMKDIIGNYKTTSHYLSFLKSKKTFRQKKTINNNSVSVSIMGMAENKSERNSEPFSPIQKFYNRMALNNNSIHELNYNKPVKSKFSAEMLDGNNNLLLNTSPNLLIRPGYIFTGITHLPFIAGRKESRIFEEYDKRKITEVILIFDEFIESINDFYEKFFQIKYDVFTIVNQNRLQSKKIIEIVKFISKFDEWRDLLDANSNFNIQYETKS